MRRANEELIAFEQRVAEAFKAKLVKGPVHLSGGNEEQLIKIFEKIDREDWCFCSYRQHYHALLHGVPEEKLFKAICDGHSMTLQFPEHRFFSSAIVGGQVPIAVGVAAALKRQGKSRAVHCFVGDMASTIGVFYEALQYTDGHALPIFFYIEDNGLSCDSPTSECWGPGVGGSVVHYSYKRHWPHVGVAEWVNF